MVGRRIRAPLIGITCEAVPIKKEPDHYDLLCDYRYAEAVKNAGGHPLLLPIASRNAVRRRYLEGIDGLVIVGGDDVDPGLYGHPPLAKTRPVLPIRSRFESWLYKAGVRLGLPILGICYGMQLINVLEGGTLQQNLKGSGRGIRVKHQGRTDFSHPVNLSEGSRLRDILEVDRALVASEHNQAVLELAPRFKVAAVADDGIIEAIEKPGRQELICVQWHPERRLQSIVTQRLFTTFVEACTDYRSRR